MYAKINLTNNTVIAAPVPLPSELVGLAQSDLYDLTPLAVQDVPVALYRDVPIQIPRLVEGVPVLDEQGNPMYFNSVIQEKIGERIERTVRLPGLENVGFWPITIAPLPLLTEGQTLSAVSYTVDAEAKTVTARQTAV